MFIAHTCQETREANIESLKQVPTGVEVNGTQYIADAYLWRDFMPMSPPDGKPLRSSVTISTSDSTTISPDIMLIRQAVVGDNQLWEKEIEETERTDISVKGFSKGGPKWNPGTKVDVVIEFKVNGEKYKVRAADITIEKTQ